MSRNSKCALAGIDDVDIAVCPTFVALAKVGHALKGSNITLGAQDTFWKESGAWTRQIAPGMLIDVGCKWVIIGHSETRGRFGTVDAELASVLSYFGESDATVNMKTKTAFAAGLTPDHRLRGTAVRTRGRQDRPGDRRPDEDRPGGLHTSRP